GPGERPVSVPHLGVERVGALGADPPRGGRVGPPPGARQALGLPVGQRLAVAPAERRERLAAAGGDINTRHHQRPEVVALARLIGSDGASTRPPLRPSLPPPTSAIRRFPPPCTNELAKSQMGRLSAGATSGRAAEAGGVAA